MSYHNKLQQLCRKYLKKLYRKARDIGLDKFVEKTIAENENGRCTATVEQVNMLASLCGDDRIKRTEEAQKYFSESVSDLDEMKKNILKGLVDRFKGLTCKIFDDDVFCTIKF